MLSPRSILSTTTICFILLATLVQAQLDSITCANVTVGVPSVKVKTTLGTLVSTKAFTLNPLCLCIDVNAALTSDSSSTLYASVEVEVDSWPSIFGLGLNTVLSAVNSVAQGLGANIVQGATSECLYPANAQSICGVGQCEFTCPSSGCLTCPNDLVLTQSSTLTSSTDSTTFTSTYVCSASSDVPAAETGSASAPTVSQRKRRSNLNARTICPVDHMACAVLGVDTRKTTLSPGKYQCLDTTTRLESCGGCPFPFPGQSKGVDCTSIPNVDSSLTDSVSCLDSICIIDSCIRGFVRSTNGSSCIPTPKHVFNLNTTTTTTINGTPLVRESEPISPLLPRSKRIVKPPRRPRLHLSISTIEIDAPSSLKPKSLHHVRSLSFR